MPMITDTMIYSNARNAVMHSQVRLSDATRRASTGLRVATAGDDPAAAEQTVLLDANLEQLRAMKAAGDRTSSTFENSTRDLQDVQTVLTRATELAVQGANGTYTAGDRTAIAAEVQSLHDTVLAIANKQDEMGQYVYSGFKTDTVPFTAAGVYSGDNNARRVEVAPNIQVNANLPGSQVFNVATGVNVLGVLQTLQAALAANNPAGAQASLNDLSTAVNQVATAQTVVGAQEALLNNAGVTRTTNETSLRNTRQAVIELDSPQAYSDLIEAEAAYQAAITESSRILKGLRDGLNI
jgi:flagellar hook-associated protein 3 FlgL